MSTAAQN